MVELYAKNTPNTQITFLSFIVVHNYIGKPSYISFLVKVKLSSPLRALHCVYPYITQITQLYKYSLLPMTMQRNLLVENLLTYVNDNSASYLT